MATDISRRRVLEMGTALFAAGSVAGCLGASSGEGGGSTNAVRATFFVLTDFARNVAGDAATVESLVPIGQHGHGWEPSVQVQRDAFESDAVVYMGEGFQPWADDVVENVRNERPELTVVAARRGIDLLPARRHEERHAGEHANESEEGEHRGQDRNGNRSEASEEDEGGRDHGAIDPHFWLDPRRSKRAVSTIEDGLSGMDGTIADALAENAARYRNRLNELDERFESELESAEKSAVLVAGHDAFRYLVDRYGFEVHALTGLAPDSAPSPADVRRAQELIAEHEIEHVLAPVFESGRAAKQLVAETDAKDHLPITPIPGVTEEWNERGWGYVEIMERVNLPSLKTALGAK
ncbi:metal ABC transporter substrate-binding protein [Haladaptatus salinisoli]|uniref:metal ABC transporter substrate-binding protein n=1 Tax=Haladaptatus salinisoli TaxID=2884876 RepID=UPI001D0BE0A7|nr:metal ABC transporter substrate-binding protein [Haladaptatus salinisoli]